MASAADVKKFDRWQQWQSHQLSSSITSVHILKWNEKEPNKFKVVCKTSPNVENLLPIQAYLSLLVVSLIVSASG